MSISFTVPDGRRVRFVHIPKCGGIWVRFLLQKMEQQQIITNCTYDNDELVSDHGTSWMYDSVDVCFTVVRHPVTWYESFWRYQQEHDWKVWEPGKWHPFRPLEKCASDDFDEFIEKCLDLEPAFVTRMYEWYIGPPDTFWIHYIGRQEKLSQTVSLILLDIVGKDFGVPANVEVNKSTGPPAIWDDELKSVVEGLEAPAIERFYGEGAKRLYA